MMNAKSISDIKRRLNPDKRNPTVIHGCYVAADGHLISTFSEPVYHLSEQDNDKYMALFRRGLSGTPGQNLLPVEFSARQAMDGVEHKLLMQLRETRLKDEETVNEFFRHVCEVIEADSASIQSADEMQKAPNWLILLTYDGMDYAKRDINGQAVPEQGGDVFSYILCAVCPVKAGKETLSYVAADGNFHNKAGDWTVGAPEHGFLFPAFEDGGANIYEALLYTRDQKNAHEAFVTRIFGTQPSMPANEQQQTLQVVLERSLQDECSLDVVQQVHETVNAVIEQRKADKNSEAPVLTCEDIQSALTQAGVTEEKAAAFAADYHETFGEYAALPAVNVLSPKEFKVQTPSVSIRVDPQHSDLIETRMIDGKCYIMILADGDVQVNGVNVRI